MIFLEICDVCGIIFLYSYINNADSMENNNAHSSVITQPIYSTGEEMTIDVTAHLAEMTSDYQRIAFVDTNDFGRCLIIDGVVQTAESDHAIYDAQMLSEMQDSDRNVMILGGGDGYIAQMALARNTHVYVEVVDLDEMVVDGCKNFLDQKIFDEERVKLHIGDALAYMCESEKKYDGIICDLTDAPVGAKELAEFEEFFDEVISLASMCIRDGGWISMQAGASEVAEAYINSVNVLETILKKYFSSVERRDVMILSYGESCAFLFGRKG